LKAALDLVLLKAPGLFRVNISPSVNTIPQLPRCLVFKVLFQWASAVTWEALNQAVAWKVSQYVSQSVSQSVSRPAIQSMSQFVIQSIGESVL